MSAHFELDFADDGSVTLTGRPEKNAAVRSVVLSANARGGFLFGVRAGDDDTETHVVRITDASTTFIDSRDLCA